MKIITKYSNLIFIIILLLIVAIIYHNWISFNIFTNGDWNFAFAPTIKENLNLFSWSFMVNLGGVNYILWNLPLYYGYGILGALGFGTSVSDKVLVFWPTLILANISSFLLVKKVTKSDLAGFVGAIVFNYNTYYFIAGTAFLLYSASAWSMVTLLIFINAVEKRKLSFFLLSTLTLFITGFYDFRIAYITIFLLFFYILFSVFYVPKVNFKQLIKYLFIFVGMISVFLLLNMYWILSFFGSKSLANNVILERGLFGNEFLNILYSISFYHPFWTGGRQAVFNPQPIMSYFWLIPILAFIGLYLNRKNKYILFFGFVSLFGIFLTKQVGYPFPGVYTFLFHHLPGFNAFREASKFYYLIAVGYSVLIGGLAVWIWQNWRMGRIQKYSKYLLIFLIVLIFLYTSKPIFTGEMEGIYIPHKVPVDYLKLNKILLNDDKYSRTLWIPRFSRWGMVTKFHPEITIVDELSGEWNSFIKSDGAILQGEQVSVLLNKSYANNLLDVTSIRYIIIPVEDKLNQDDLFGFYGKSRRYYIDELNKIKYLHKVELGTKNLVIYQNYDYKPHIYITYSKETIYEKIPFQKIGVSFVNGAEYKIKLKNISKTAYLNFSESYHPDWKIHIGSFNWLDVLTNKNYFISDKYHFKNDASLNSYYIDPSVVCKVESCKVNKDGSYDINMTLYFAPQSYMYLGLLISGATLTLVFSYLFFALGRNLYERKKK